MSRGIFCRILFIIVVIVGILGFSSVLSAQGRRQEAFERVKAVQERHTKRLIAIRDVEGTAVGLNQNGEPAVKVFTARRGVAGIPKTLDGVPVVVVVSGKIYALKPPTNKPPKAPRALVATAISNSQINLDWKDNRESDVVYNVYRSETPGGGYSFIDSTGVSNDLDDELLSGTTYYYVVTAENAFGESGYSNEASATTAGGVEYPPEAPSSLNATTVSSSQINLAWTDTSGNETGFSIERKIGEGSFVEIATVGANVTNYSNMGLSPLTTYTYRVCAYNSAGDSGYSNEASATTEGGVVDPPEAPSSLNATAVSSSQINLAWTDTSGNETGFSIERRFGSSFVEIATVGANVTAYSNTGLASSTEYTYRVCAYNSAGDSGYSNEASATTLSGPVTPIDPSDRFARPVPIGVSTGHPDITAGTIGCRVVDGFGNVYALSNNHVYANENRASIGDNVLQPGTYDGGVDPDDKIGTLTAFVPINFGMFGINTVDAAIASSSIAELDNSTPTGLGGGYGIPDSTTTTAFVGQPVQKYGRTTGLTTGTVTDINGAFLVRYSRSYAVFYNQIVVGSGGFSSGGDSGSLVVTDDGNYKPVGLLFAGSDTTTIINPIDDVLGALGVSIDGE